jgi:hypothetical protein
MGQLDSNVQRPTSMLWILVCVAVCELFLPNPALSSFSAM